MVRWKGRIPLSPLKHPFSFSLRAMVPLPLGFLLSNLVAEALLFGSRGGGCSFLEGEEELFLSLLAGVGREGLVTLALSISGGQR